MVHCTSFQIVNQRCPIPASTEALAHALLDAIDALTEVFHVEDVRGVTFHELLASVVATAFSPSPACNSSHFCMLGKFGPY